MLHCSQIVRNARFIVHLLIFAIFACVSAQAQSFTNQSSQLPDIGGGFASEGTRGGSTSGEPAYSGIAIGVVDMNGDGRDDIVRIHQGSQVVITLQNSSRGFSNHKTIDLGYPVWSTAMADIDGDGTMDIFAGGDNNRRNLLLGKDGWQNFGGARLPLNLPSGQTFFAQGASFLDLNHDGNLELFVAGGEGKNMLWTYAGGTTLQTADHLLSSNPTPSGGNRSATWTDVDGDGDFDLYLAKALDGASSSDLRRRNMFFQSQFAQDGSHSYRERASTIRLNDSEQSYAAEFADLDNDGLMEAIVLDHTKPGSAHGGARLFRQDSYGRFFEDTSFGVSLGFKGAQLILADFDNDGYQDLLLAGDTNGTTRLWRNTGTGDFTPVTDFRVSINGAMQNPGTLSVGDLNNDGFLDIYAGYVDFIDGFGKIANVAAANRPDQLWLNNGNSNGFVKVSLTGDDSPAHGIGSRITVTQSAKNDGFGESTRATGTETTQIRDVRAGHGFGIMNSLEQHFGLGTNPAPVSITVDWASGKQQTLTNITPGSAVQIKEDVKPDLAVTGFTTANPAPMPGETINLSITVANLSETHAGSSRLALYLSDTDRIDYNVAPRTYTVEDVPVNGQFVLNIPYTIPANAGATDQWLHAVVNHGATLDEGPIGNNDRALPLQIGLDGVDLAISTHDTHTDNIDAGRYLYVSAIVENIGSQDASSSELHYYLSNDIRFNPQDDVRLGVENVPPLGAGATSAQSHSVRIPPSTPWGPKYIFFVANTTGSVTEINTNNNIEYRAIHVNNTLLPDMVVENTTATPTNVVAGDRITLSATLRNAGHGVPPEQTVGYFLSQDQTYDDGDIPLKFQNVGVVNPVMSIHNFIDVPNVGGTWHILWVADFHNVIHELNETNNAGSFEIFITGEGKDLYNERFTASPTSNIMPGDALWVTHRVANRGTSTAGNTTAAIYLSTDQTLSGNDTLLFERTVGVLSSGAGSYNARHITMPSNLPEGTSYLLFVADRDDVIDESNENNNVAAIEISRTATGSLPDLELTQASVALSEIQVGDPITLRITAENSGSSSSFAQSNAVYVYIYTDSSLSSDDPRLTWFSVPNLEGGASYSKTKQMLWPNSLGLTPGDYYLIYKIDPNNVVPETNENNNKVTIAFKINP
ncbi:CARDB domain-containing protein [Acanthopleuribacter pedis]|uniref:VCBS repeat-containing protein n=1 Tax=Acanthopleuribacter pedis TaxID=442870 RepID=A0A8J7Q9Y0_9BACT|nr:CARDB domain-containing protein [Acanthopleuribacter pedis]MBO1320154.1 VCBS repeat-containing protein [Acanthopleuribacter pedis]